MPAKIIALAFALAAIIIPVRPAHAWDEVCVHFPLWKTAFVAKFAVLYGFDDEGGLPRRHPLVSGHTQEELAPRVPGTDDSTANGAVFSPNFVANQTRCVDISVIPPGDRFFVALLPNPFPIAPPDRGIICETHPSNPDKFYYQQNRPYRKIWFDGWGGVAHPKCKYTRESN